MRSIEIKTSDQVIINFEISGLRDRALAFIIDSSIMYGVIVVASIVFSLIIPLGQYSFYLVIAPIFFFYTLAFEIFLGGVTPGKKAMKIRVIKLNGDYASPMDYIIRWLFRWLDIWMSFFVIGSVLINSNRYGQRLGDMMAGTTLIKLQSKSSVSLTDILNIDTQKEYAAKYPQVVQLSDENMLLVKNTLKRLQSNTNKSGLRVLDALVDQLKSELKIEDKIDNKVEFLKTLLKDYVVLTR